MHGQCGRTIETGQEAQPWPSSGNARANAQMLVFATQDAPT
jgi:hypothetical protein